MSRLREKDIRGVEMKRRTFLQKMIVAGSTALAGCIVLIKGILPKRFVWAKPMAKYPGRLKAVENIDTQSKWSG